MKKLISIIVIAFIIFTAALPHTALGIDNTDGLQASRSEDVSGENASEDTGESTSEEPETEPTTEPATEPTTAPPAVILPSSANLSYYSLSLTVNETAVISASVEPHGAVYSGSFSSDNEAVVTVDAYGNITALKKGKANIIYQTDNGITASCSVAVNNTKLPVKLNSTSVTLIYDKKIKKGTAFLLKCEKQKKDFFKIEYSSANKNIAEVSQEGVITPKKAGKTVISVKADGVTKTCAVKVIATSNKSLTLNEKANRAAIKKSSCERIVYGTSVQGRELEAYVIKGKKSSKDKILFIDFACHGFEDSYAKDGKVLVNIANELVSYYASHTSKLKSYTLVVVPCANPDGTIAGKNNLRACSTAFGRCTAAHVDMNRDFGAFKGKESRALKGLMDNYRPDVYLNFHGWLDETLGTPWLTKQSASALKLSRPRSNLYGKGYIATYVKKAYGASVCLVEYKSPASARASIGRTKNCLNRIMNG